MDEEESSRISLEDGYTLILVDIPSPEVRHEKKMYTTIPLGILIKQNAIITICKEDTPVLQYFAISFALFFGVYVVYFGATYVGFIRNIEE